MEINNKQVSIQVKVDEQTWIELKQQAKRRGYKFSSYIKKLLLKSLINERKEQKDEERIF